MEKHPELFKPNYQIKSVYGTLINSYMDGGRQIESKINPLIAESIIQDYSHFGVNYSHVMSAYYDKFYPEDVNMNKVLSLANRYKNNIIVSDLELIKYVKQFYSDITIVGSAVRLDDIEDTTNFIRNNTFDYAVLQTKYNNSLNLVPEDIKNKIVILPNDCCPCDCPMKRPCYERTFDLNRTANFTHIKWGQWNIAQETPCKNQDKLKKLKEANTWWDRTIKIPS
jgi:hypothetical protein